MNQQKENKTKNNKNVGRVIAVVIALIVLLAITVFKVFVDNDYEANHTVEEYQKITNNEIEITDNIISIQNQNSKGKGNRIGIIFYSGEKIDGKCYIPLMASLSNEGYNTFLPTTFGNLPMLNLEGAGYVMRTFTGIKQWYVLAHGPMACQVAAQFVSNNKGKIKGLIYLGGYSEGIDLSDRQTSFLSIYGSNDSVIDKSKVEATKKYNPGNSKYSVIEGANFTNFADTKLIKGDTKGKINFDEQIDETVNLIDYFIKTINR